jgi:hypothetical protein
MKAETIITAVLVLSLVWGGVATFLIRAIKCEKNKSDLKE